jgi:rod shape-determining protein MreD
MPRLRTFALIGKFGAVAVAAVVIQAILSFKFRVFNYFDLPLICSVYYGFTLSNPIASILLGSTLGVMQDSLSGAALGINGFAKTVIGFLAASAAGKFAVDQPITRLLGLFLFTLGDGLLVSMLTLVIAPGSNSSYAALGGWLLSATFNSLLGLAFLGYHDRWRDART